MTKEQVIQSCLAAAVRAGLIDEQEARLPMSPTGLAIGVRLRGREERGLAVVELVLGQGATLDSAAARFCAKLMEMQGGFKELQ